MALASSLYSTEELRQVQAVMKMIAKRQGSLPPEEGDEASEPAVEIRDERRFASSNVRGNRC